MKKQAVRKVRRADPPKRRVRWDEAGFPRRLLMMLAFAVLTALIVEGFNQSTVPRMIQYLTQHPLSFALNCMVVLVTLSISELFKRRKAVVWTISSPVSSLRR